VVAVVLATLMALLARIYFDSTRGLVTLAVRENELRVEYLGGSVRQAMTINFILAAFAVVVLGGLGSVWGAYLGGLIVGVVEAFAGYYIDPALRHAIWFLIFLVVLIIRPAGLLGQVGAEEVGFREQN
jgi:branched-subunit amino acid ABC-type transport system permease component